VGAAERWAEYRRENGDAEARILQGLSGEMNHIRLVFAYPELSAYEREEARDSLDPGYAEVAGAMPFVDGTIRYEIYRELEQGESRVAKPFASAGAPARQAPSHTQRARHPMYARRPTRRRCEARGAGAVHASAAARRRRDRGLQSECSS
jgi:hypothetical protein